MKIDEYIDKLMEIGRDIEVMGCGGPRLEESEIRERMEKIVLDVQNDGYKEGYKDGYNIGYWLRGRGQIK